MCLTGSICKLLLGSHASKLRSYLIPFILDSLEPDNRSYYVPPINSSTTLFCRIGTVYLLAVLASRTVCFSSPHFREFQRPILHTWCLKYGIACYSSNPIYLYSRLFGFHGLIHTRQSMTVTPICRSNCLSRPSAVRLLQDESCASRINDLLVVPEYPAAASTICNDKWWCRSFTVFFPSVCVSLTVITV